MSSTHHPASLESIELRHVPTEDIYLPRRKYNICIVSDFFFPRLGGVELHQFSLAQCLMQRGHKVVFITGTYSTKNGFNERQGVRYVTNGLKVYYCPQLSIANQASLPTLYTFFPIFRQIMLREEIDIVHGHQTTSALAHECIMHAKTMGYKAVFTDHSLFGFANAAAIHLNKLMKFTLADIDHVVCVSHCSKENLVLRAFVDPSKISVIPNAIDCRGFTPNPSAAPNPNEQINIVILSRLVFRKGLDLVVEVIPRICERFPNVHFIIGGDGNKRILVEEMREKYGLHDRVELLGAVPHAEARNVLVRGQIFLNCSLTEAFCIAILEAVSCGLYVVSTRVGGVPEILPHDMIRFAEPNVDDVVEGLCDAIPKVKSVDPLELHERVKNMYNWRDTALRTEKVYDKIIDRPQRPLIRRFARFNECGSWAGKIFVLVIALDYLLWRLLEWWSPREDIDLAANFPRETFIRRKTKLVRECNTTF